MPKLTKRTVDAAKPPEDGKSYSIVWDDDLKGFGLLITSKGTKSYVVQYRTMPGREGRTRRFKLGRHGELTPRQAREMAENAFAAVRRGEDPAKERREKLKAPTVKKLSERYLERHARPKKKASSVRNDESILNKHILPALGRRKADSVTHGDVEDLHHAMRETPYQANRMLSLLSKMMTLAERWGMRPQGSNPCSHVERYKEKKRERFLSAAELVRLGEVLTEAEQEEQEPPAAILALRLLLLTGARKSEILELEWSEVDFERRCLRLEDSKTGEKVIPLNAPALELLDEAPRYEENPYVCAGRLDGGHFVGLSKVWERLRIQAEIEDVRIHDLRHSFASIGAGGGFSLPIIGALLGHTQSQTTARYAHLSDDPLHEASERIGGEIASHLNGESGEVRKFKS